MAGSFVSTPPLHFSASMILMIWIGSGTHVPNDPIKARQRLVCDSVDFEDPVEEPGITELDCLTYYVVTLVYEATRRPKRVLRSNQGRNGSLTPRE